MVAGTRAATDERGVSPVIGIVLLVAITVILVGVTAAYLTGVGKRTDQPAPQFVGETNVNSSFARDGQYLNLTYESGGTLDTGHVHFDVDGAKIRSGATSSGTATYDGNVIQNQAGSEFAASETVSLNRTAFVDGSGNALTGTEYVDLSDATVRIIWSTDEGDRTDIIYTCDVGPTGCVSD